MKKVVSFSGGRTSAYLCHVMIERFGRDNVDFVYMDTGAEHPKTYEFIRNVNEHLGLDLTCLRGDFNQPLGQGHKCKIVNIDDIGPDLEPYRQMVMKYGTPTVASGWCTSRMKEEVHDKYCDDKYGKGNYETWLGIRADEPARVLGATLHGLLKKHFSFDFDDLQNIYQSVTNDGPGSLSWWLKAPNRVVHNKIFKAARMLKSKFDSKEIRYMSEITDAEKEDILDWWDDMPFDLGIPEWLGNCVFCFKKSDLKLAAAAFDEPEMLEEWRKIINSAPDRNKRDGRDSSNIYRKHYSIDDVIGMFDGSTGDEIKARIRGGKMTETGSCSESCEVFVCEANQIDIFDM